MRYVIPRLLLVIALAAGTAWLIRMWQSRQTTPPPASQTQAKATAAPIPEFAVASVTPATPVAPTPAPTAVPLDLDKKSRQNQPIIREVLERIDRAPNLTNEAKAKLRAQVDRARTMGRVAIIAFDKGGAIPNQPDVDRLKTQMARPEITKLAEDPTTVFVVAGYADKSGDEQVNLKISLARADVILKKLRDECGIQNLIQPVGMGGSDLFGERDATRNRIVEVWAVLP